MAITCTTPDGTAITTLAELIDYAYDRDPGQAGVTPTNGELIVEARRKPGTAVS